MFPRILALALALLLVFACAASAFAKSGDAATVTPSSDIATAAKSGDGDTVTEPITTIGADSPTGSDSASTGEQSATMDGSENTNTEDGETDPEVERRKEIYTFMTLIALGAIIVGIREKKNKRKF
jgi:hypothetical protein